MPPKRQNPVSAVPEDLLSSQGVHKAHVDASCFAAVLLLDRRYRTAASSATAVASVTIDDPSQLGKISDASLARMLGLSLQFASYISKFERYVGEIALRIARGNVVEAERLKGAIIWFRTKAEESVDRRDFVHDLVTPELRAGIASSGISAISIAEVYALVCAAALDKMSEVHESSEVPHPTAGQIDENVELRTLTLCRAIADIQQNDPICHTGVRHALILTLNKIFPGVKIIEYLPSFYNEVIQAYFYRRDAGQTEEEAQGALVEFSRTDIRGFINLFCESLSDGAEPLKRRFMVRHAAAVERYVRNALAACGIDHTKPLSPSIADNVAVDTALVDVNLPFAAVSSLCRPIMEMHEYIGSGGVDEGLVVVAKKVVIAIAELLPSAISSYSLLEKPLEELLGFLAKITGFYRKYWSFKREEPLLVAMGFNGIKEFVERVIKETEDFAASFKEHCVTSDPVRQLLEFTTDTTERRRSFNEEIGRYIERTESVSKDVHYDFIVNIFARFYAAAAGRNFDVARAIYAQLVAQPPAILQIDQESLGSIATTVASDETLDASPYTFNRIVMHALFTSPPEWSDTFIRVFRAILEFLHTAAAIDPHAINPLQIRHRDFAKSYRLLMPELECLAEHYTAAKNSQPFNYDFSRFILITPAMYSMINNANLITAFTVLSRQFARNIPITQLVTELSSIDRSAVFDETRVRRLRSIVLGCAEIDVVLRERIFDFIEINRLRTIFMNSADLDAPSRTQLLESVGSGRLCDIILSRAGLTAQSRTQLLGFIGMDRLREIILGSTGLAAELRTRLLNFIRLDHLREIILGSAELTAELRTQLFNVIGIDRLQEIISSSTRIDTASRTQLLRNIILYSTEFTVEVRTQLLSVIGMDRLREIILGSAGLDAELRTQLLDLIGLNRLQEIILSSARLATESRTRLFYFIGSDRLREIILGSTGLAAESRTQLVDFVGLDRLRDIILRSAELDASSRTHFLDLLGVKYLKSIILNSMGCSLQIMSEDETKNIEEWIGKSTDDLGVLLVYGGFGDWNIYGKVAGGDFRKNERISTDSELDKCLHNKNPSQARELGDVLLRNVGLYLKRTNIVPINTDSQTLLLNFVGPYYLRDIILDCAELGDISHKRLVDFIATERLHDVVMSSAELEVSVRARFFDFLGVNCLNDVFSHSDVASRMRILDLLGSEYLVAAVTKSRVRGGNHAAEGFHMLSADSREVILRKFLDKKTFVELFGKYYWAWSKQELTAKHLARWQAIIQEGYFDEVWRILPKAKRTIFFNQMKAERLKVVMQGDSLVFTKLLRILSETERRHLFNDLLGAERLQTIISDGDYFAQVLDALSPAERGYLLDFLGAERLQAMVESGWQLACILHKLHGDERVHFLDLLGTERLRVVILYNTGIKEAIAYGGKLLKKLRKLKGNFDGPYNTHYQFAAVLYMLSAAEKTHLFALLGRDRVRDIIRDDFYLAAVLHVLSEDEQTRLFEFLELDYLQGIMQNGFQVASVLRMLPQMRRMTFLQDLGIDYLKSVTRKTDENHGCGLLFILQMLLGAECVPFLKLLGETFLLEITRGKDVKRGPRSFRYVEPVGVNKFASILRTIPETELMHFVEFFGIQNLRNMIKTGRHFKLILEAIFEEWLYREFVIIASTEAEKVNKWKEENRNSQNILLICDEASKKWYICGKNREGVFLENQEVLAESELSKKLSGKNVVQVERLKHELHPSLYFLEFPPVPKTAQMRFIELLGTECLRAISWGNNAGYGDRFVDILKESFIAAERLHFLELFGAECVHAIIRHGWRDNVFGLIISVLPAADCTCFLNFLGVEYLRDITRGEQWDGGQWCSNLGAVLKALSKADRMPLLELLGGDSLRLVIPRKCHIIDVFNVLPVSDRIRFCELLGVRGLQAAVYDGATLLAELSWLPEEEMARFIKILGAEHIKSILQNGCQLAAVLRKLPETERTPFAESLGADRVQAIVKDGYHLAAVLMCALPQAEQVPFLLFLGAERLRTIIQDSTQLLAVLRELPAAERPHLTEFFKPRQLVIEAPAVDTDVRVELPGTPQPG